MWLGGVPMSGVALHHCSLHAALKLDAVGAASGQACLAEPCSSSQNLFIKRHGLGKLARCEMTRLERSECSTFDELFLSTDMHAKLRG